MLHVQSQEHTVSGHAQSLEVRALLQGQCRALTDGLGEHGRAVQRDTVTNSNANVVYNGEGSGTSDSVQPSVIGEDTGLNWEVGWGALGASLGSLVSSQLY